MNESLKWLNFIYSIAKEFSMKSHAPVNHLLALALLTCALLSSAAGQEQKPAQAPAQTKNFSGTWKMNVAKSKFGSDDAPRAIAVIFEQHGLNLSEALTITGSEGEERKFDLKFTLDGKESTNQLGEGEQAKSTAKMEGDALVIELQGRQGPFRRRFTLSEDGKVMTILVNRSEGGTEKTDTIVLDKQ